LRPPPNPDKTPATNVSHLPSILPIRLAIEADAPELARLFTALGYPASGESVLANWRTWSAAGSVALVAPNADGTLAGVASLSRTVVLHRPKPVGRIVALVVDEPMQKHGIGRALMAAAEKYLTEAGCGIIEVTSQNKFVDAHAFYKHIGYEQTSLRFSKVL
jgi:GNAT superfamily N-acetyltransferase